MANYTLPLDPIANIMVNLSARSAVRKAFNLALLMGDVGDKVDFGSARIKTYENTTEMLQDGFTTSDRLYKAAALIFGQAKTPPKVAIGKAMKTDSALETPLATLQACREDDGEWYIGIYCGAISNDQILDVRSMLNRYLRIPYLRTRRMMPKSWTPKMAAFSRSSRT